MKSFKGHFITIEGGEGSGKTTLIPKLADYLVERGYPVVITREPGGTKLGEMIRSLVLSHNGDLQIGHQAELLLFLAARSQHIEEVIKPALEAGEIVLCDRFNDSTMAYQGAARGLDPKFVQKFCHLVCGDVEPELTLFLDVDPEVGLQRSRRTSKDTAAQGEHDRIESEKLEFHKQVQESFRQLAKREPLRIYRIDANKTPDYTFKEAVRAVEEFILLPRSKHSA